MTRCDNLNRWLDEGMPEAGGTEARAHAAACPRCGKAIAAVEAIDRAFALPPTPLPDGAAFTARVMEQVIAAAPVEAPRPETKRDPWWLAILSEPAFTVAAAVAVVLILTPFATRFDASRSVGLPASVALQTFGTMLGSTLAGWFGTATPVETLTPISRLAILLAFAPLFVWAGFWMFGAVERLVRNIPARRG